MFFLSLWRESEGLSPPASAGTGPVKSLERHFLMVNPPRGA